MFVMQSKYIWHHNGWKATSHKAELTSCLVDQKEILELGMPEDDVPK